MFDSRSETAARAERRMEARAASMGRFPPRAVHRAIDFIHANLASGINLQDMARAAGLSVFHFSRTFTKTTGLGPHRYLTQARIDKVKELLLKSDYSLAAIADEAGFSDQSHMSKVFRRFIGTSPRHFRSTCRSERAVALQTVSFPICE
jgi:AraC family transcriptional regulator